MTGSGAPPSPPKKSLAWMGLGLLVMPALFAIVLLLQEPKASAPVVSARPQDEQDVPADQGSRTRDRSTGPGKPALSPRLEPESSSSSPADLTEGDPQELVGANEEDANEEDWDGRIERFDENAQSFDERVALFEEEKARGLMDEISRKRLLWSLARDLGELSPRARAEVECTVSICEIELTGPSTVGSLIADLAPFLREHPRGATGQARDDADPERAFRLLFPTDALPTSNLESPP